MAGTDRDIRLRKTGTGEVVTVTATPGGLLKATRLIGSWLTSGVIKNEEPHFSFTWFYLAARRAGLDGTDRGDIVKIEHVESFFELWDVDEDEEEQADEPTPFYTETESPVS